MSKVLDDIIEERIQKISYLRSEVFKKTQEISELLTDMNDKIIELRYFQEKKVSLTSKLSKKVSLQVGSTS